MEAEGLLSSSARARPTAVDCRSLVSSRLSLSVSARLSKKPCPGTRVTRIQAKDSPHTNQNTRRGTHGRRTSAAALRAAEAPPSQDNRACGSGLVGSSGNRSVGLESCTYMRPFHVRSELRRLKAGPSGCASDRGKGDRRAGG